MKLNKNETNLADFEFIEERGMLIIPGLWNNKVTAYMLK
jgi:hypothetical protein